MRRFLSCGRGSVALESAIALSVLVGAFASLMHIVADVFAEDRAGRGARAAARAIALDPSADPWAALKREGGLGANAVCPAWTATDTTATCGGWTLTVHREVSPGTLGAVLGGGDADPGEMVLVRLEKTPPNAGDPPKTVALGLARSEPRG